MGATEQQHSSSSTSSSSSSGISPQIAEIIKQIDDFFSSQQQDIASLQYVYLEQVKSEVKKLLTLLPQCLSLRIGALDNNVLYLHQHMFPPQGNNVLNQAAPFTRLLYLSGVVPIQHNNTVYYIPISIWIPRDYPLKSPICFVVEPDAAAAYANATASSSSSSGGVPMVSVPVFQIARNHKHVHISGRIYLPYISSWYCNPQAISQQQQSSSSPQSSSSSSASPSPSSSSSSITSGWQSLYTSLSNSFMNISIASSPQQHHQQQQPSPSYNNAGSGIHIQPKANSDLIQLVREMSRVFSQEIPIYVAGYKLIEPNQQQQGVPTVPPPQIQVQLQQLQQQPRIEEDWVVVPPRQVVTVDPVLIPSPAPAPIASSSPIPQSPSPIPLPQPPVSSLPPLGQEQQQQASAPPSSPSSVVDEEHCCPICQEPEQERPRNRVFVPCGHVICSDCASEWKQPLCPICRTKYAQIIKIFLN